MPRSFRTTFRFLRLVRLSLSLLSKQAAVGGQAVLEGVMMRGPGSWAVAVRRADGTIAVHERESTAFALRHRWARLPILRGVVALGESLGIGFRALSVSAEYAMEWEDAQNEKLKSTTDEVERSDTISTTDTSDAPEVAVDSSDEAPSEDAFTRAEAAPENLTKLAIAGAFILAIGFSVLLFKLTPALATSVVLEDRGSFFFALLEGCIRVSIFIMYLVLVGFMPDMKRVFQYHSAEHKAINAWEHGIELQPELVNQQSRIHVRCGTAFLLWVFVVGILVFGIYGYLRDPSLAEVLLSRVVFLPLLAGLSFELIRYAGKHADNHALRTALAPGLWLQRLTTRECEPDQCEVAVASLNAVLKFEEVKHTTEHPDDAQLTA